MRILDYIKENTLYLDGAMGSLLQSQGLAAGEAPERWNLTHPEQIIKIHSDYFDAGTNVVCANTFGSNLLKFDSSELEQIIASAINNAKEAIKNSHSKQPKWVALDVGPTGRMLKPLGDLDFEEAVSVFAESVRLGAKYGADLIFIETMTDSYETKAALLAAKENCDLPIFVTNAYGADGKLMTGAEPKAMIAMLEGMGADAIGINCSLGPRELYSVVDEYLKYASVPIIFKPNAGLPRVENNDAIYDLSSIDFASDVADTVKRGVRAVGGCCGTTPEYISELVNKTVKITPKPIEKKNISLISSYTHGVEIGKEPILIGERINPTGKPRFREAVKNGDMEHILREAIGQEEKGVSVLDVNLGIPGIDEADMLTKSVKAIQAICDLPLQIDSSDPVAMESALRIYNGKAMINSVNGKKESLDKILPLVRKYGGVVVALTLDEKGIPKKAEERVAIAKKILSEAEKYGIEPKDIVFDPLAMAVSADRNAAVETLKAVKMISEELGCHTSLGISNVSFGLPGREHLNSAFLSMALTNNLSAAIINPYSDEIMKEYYSYLALSGQDVNFEKYIESADAEKQVKSQPNTGIIDLKSAIINGLGDLASSITKELLCTEKPLDIVNNEIIPALDQVGQGYEEKKIYLPGLLMSAEAAGAAFRVIKKEMPSNSKENKCSVVIATVKGDIHDIGKNIVKLILENYGYSVIDLGKDVDPEVILSAIEREGAVFVALSALMTTTLPAMEQTVALIKERAPQCKIMVGGAVLTEDYALKIGADFYGKDAMDAVRFVEKNK